MLKSIVLLYKDLAAFEVLTHVIGAIDHEVRGSLALPIIDLEDQSCRAVLELVTVKENPNFDHEIDNVCRALQMLEIIIL
ncbi:hypothetical protein MKW98_025399 [Papaver atlanticum]|uniref:GAF domain-containing protein n=1 Tax=Papaver atlanticum TaxID=357466 RepID=A0AAD4SC36_9MAGN|nr:hypothetical protein MKW98_025399 [Papaver atlanticum]